MTIKVKSLADLTVSPTLGGPDASWIVRWTHVTPGHTGNGHIYYAGMDNNGAGTGVPSFFAGDTSCIPGPGNPAEHCKYLTYPQTTKLSASQAGYNAGDGRDHAPRSGERGRQSERTTLYSVTAFTATSAQGAVGDHHLQPDRRHDTVRRRLKRAVSAAPGVGVDRHGGVARRRGRAPA